MKTTYHNHVIELERDHYSNTLRWNCFIEGGSFVKGQSIEYFENIERSAALDKAKAIIRGDIRVTAQPCATRIIP